MKIAVVGATGLVGTTMLKVLEERNVVIRELLLAASEKSVGNLVAFRKENIKVDSIQGVLDKQPHVAIFSAGGKVSKEWAPKFAEKGIAVIDNSSAWRMEANVKLVVPEINGHLLTKSDKIIANPNCSTIQLVVALADLHKHFNIKRIVISTYQSVSGTGVKAVQQLEAERHGKTELGVYPHPIDMNCLPHGGDFDENGSTTEETKLVNETRKILGDDAILVSATVVRVPVIGGHSESVNVEFEKPFSLAEAVSILSATQGVVVQDDPMNNVYPMPIYAHHKDEVFVGRIRKDTTVEHGLNMWIVADNLRKGAATNAVQIAEFLVEHHLC